MHTASKKGRDETGAVARINGEAVVYLAADDGTMHISFAATQSRPRSARELADQYPATYVAFDILTHPAAGFPDLRPRPYVERRQVLLDVLAGVGPPLETVWSTTDRDEALLWYATLEGTGGEGLVAKPLRPATSRSGSDQRPGTRTRSTPLWSASPARPGIRKRSPYGCPTDASRCPSG
ncbi:hypothetical protein [Streptomyces sp. NPDC051677]|uniref:ATP-dependent DNA ligase n=1 Tax=Streptomyces sp. NPDC051677 TaxID=3365669 RepID=UPI0037D761AA